MRMGSCWGKSLGAGPALGGAGPALGRELASREGPYLPMAGGSFHTALRAGDTANQADKIPALIEPTAKQEGLGRKEVKYKMHPRADGEKFYGCT